MPEKPSGPAAFPALKISSFDELVSQEAEVLRRIRARPNGARLLLVHPRRLLGDIGVHLDPAVIDEWSRRACEDLFATTGLEGTYDAVADSDPTAGPSITLKALLKGKNV
jgi:hypothetical protein